jgi:Gas vesicle synthesis protein GvpL/GvpF
MIWVYAVAERPDLPLPACPGLMDAPLEGVTAGDLLAVVTQHDGESFEPTPDAMWAQERVLEHVMADRAVLPMRFGTTRPDATSLRRALMERHDDLASALTRVRGRVELGVRAVADRTPPPAATGRDWLAARLETSRLAASVHEPLAALAAADHRRTPVAPGELLRAAYLVDRAKVDGFGAAVERLQQQQPAVSIVCTGPWPPFSFVTAP